MKGYYMTDIAKSLKNGRRDIFNHVDFNWKVLKSCGGLPEPSIEEIMSKKSKIKV